MVRESERASSRLILSFGLDAFRAAAELVGRYDLGLLFVLIAFANIETFTLPDEAAVFSRTPVPDNERRPISANAVAVELGVPRETVRRQVNQLIAMGMVVRDGRRGLIVPGEVSLRPDVVAVQERILVAFCRMAQRSIETGLAWPDDDRPSGWADKPRPDFLINRHIMAFGLRLATATLPMFSRLEDAIVLHAVTEGNLREVTADPDISLRYASMARPGPPDSIRKPVTTAALVERTGIPTTTMNRTLRRLVLEGMVVRRGRAVMAPAAVFERADFRAATERVAGYLTQAVARLASVGVTGRDLCRWADEAGDGAMFSEAGARLLGKARRPE